MNIKTCPRCCMDHSWSVDCKSSGLERANKIDLMFKDLTKKLIDLDVVLKETGLK